MSDPTYYPIPSAEPPAPTDTPTTKPSRGKWVLAGAALVAAGLVAGGGAMYAVTSQIAPSSGSTTVQPGAPGERGAGPRGGNFGAPPDGSNPGAVPDGTTPDTAPGQSAAPEDGTQTG